MFASSSYTSNFTDIVVPANLQSSSFSSNIIKSSFSPILAFVVSITIAVLSSFRLIHGSLVSSDEIKLNFASSPIYNLLSGLKALFKISGNSISCVFPLSIFMFSVFRLVFLICTSSNFSNSSNIA